MRRFKWSWLWALVVCLGGLCLAHQMPAAFVALPLTPSVTPAPVETVVTLAPAMATVTPAPTEVVPTPTLTWTPTPNAEPMTITTRHSITVTIVYDNYTLDARLKTAWGFASLVETGEATILFDTGSDGRLLMNNLATLGFDPRRIGAVILSHDHEDHTGGLDALLGVNDAVTVFAPRSFSDEFKARVSKRSALLQTHEPMTITDHIRVTGEMGTSIVEQSLIIETDQGLIVMTGCAHPGIAEIVRQAKRSGDVYLVVGGFHLGDKSAQEVEAIITELKRLGVRQVAPCHCTGERAIQQFKAAFGADFIQAGAGLRIVVPAVD